MKWIFTASALAIIMVRTKYPSLLPDDKITLGLLIAAILPWILSFLSEVELPGGLKFKVRQLENKTAVLEEEVERTRKQIDNLMINSMSPKTLGQLKKISSGKFGTYWLGIGLSRELSYLENIGYITFKPPCEGIEDIPKDGKNLDLSNYVSITPQGKEYLDLRIRIVAEKPRPLVESDAFR